MELENLKKELPYKWKIQTLPKPDKKGCCVAYIDSRYVQDLLDEVCGPDKWQSEFYEVKGKVFCKIGIKIGDEWVWKSDSGALESDDKIELETTSKGETSDAFKRAGVQWGIGRFLYSKEMYWIDEDEYKQNKYKLTEYINGKKNNSSGNTPDNNITKKWLNYESFKQIIDSGNTTEAQIAKIIKDDGFTLSNQAKIAVRHYITTGELDKGMFFKTK